LFEINKQELGVVCIDSRLTGFPALPPTLTHLTCTDTVLISSAYIYLKKRKKDKIDFVVNMVMHFFLAYIPCILTLSKFYYSPSDALVNCLKSNFKIYIKTAATCFGAVTPLSGSELLVLAHIIVW
jgi:hypothetical protein